MNTAIYVIIVVSALIVLISTLLQETKSDGISALTNGDITAISQKKVQGMEAIYHKVTIISSLVFFASVVCAVIFW